MCARPTSRSYAAMSAIAAAVSAGSGPTEPVFRKIPAAREGMAERTAASFSGSGREGSTTARMIPAMSGLARPELLATTEWLAENLGRSAIRILDLRWRPDGSGPAVHAAGHIPGAVLVDWRRELVEDGPDGETIVLAGPDRVAEFAARTGIADGTTV